jgi:hypothetical protein
VQIVENGWQRRHLKSINHNYSKTKYLSAFPELMNWLYKTPHINLSSFNQESIKIICSILGIKTIFINASDLECHGTKDELLISICKELGGKEYVSGPSARNYINPDKFNLASIKLTFKDYSHYPEYPQLFQDFLHNVSILDLLFNCGPNAMKYIRSNG